MKCEANTDDEFQRKLEWTLWASGVCIDSRAFVKGLSTTAKAVAGVEWHRP
jgi:hypothetical protein